MECMAKVAFLLDWLLILAAHRMNLNSTACEETEEDDKLLQDLFIEFGLRDDDYDRAHNSLSRYDNRIPQQWQMQNENWTHRQWAMALIAGGVATFNVVALLSLYPVLRGRGAPYLPTRRSNLDRMFAQLQQNDDFSKLISETSSSFRKRRPRFVDLGSGDGRVVFRAAREGMFSSCTGYEINPMLHGFAQLRRMLTPKYWSSTRFGLGDIWKVDLTDVDVVAVYGLSPMMKDLGVKLRQELKPGSFVLSNVFSIPGWKPIDTSLDGTHIYRIPQQENQ